VTWFACRWKGDEFEARPAQIRGWLNDLEGELEHALTSRFLQAQRLGKVGALYVRHKSHDGQLTLPSEMPPILFTESLKHDVLLATVILKVITLCDAFRSLQNNYWCCLSVGKQLMGALQP
jgi:hypothetical protein